MLCLNGKDGITASWWPLLQASPEGWLALTLTVHEAWVSSAYSWTLPLICPHSFGALPSSLSCGFESLTHSYFIICNQTCTSGWNQMGWLNFNQIHHCSHKEVLWIMCVLYFITLINFIPVVIRNKHQQQRRQNLSLITTVRQKLWETQSILPSIWVHPNAFQLRYRFKCPRLQFQVVSRCNTDRPASKCPVNIKYYSLDLLNQPVLAVLHWWVSSAYFLLDVHHLFWVRP